MKIEKDSQLLKMILNVQNIQIQKMTEIYYLNQALLFHYVLDKKEKDKTNAKGTRNDLKYNLHVSESCFARSYTQNGTFDASLRVKTSYRQNL